MINTTIPRVLRPIPLAFAWLLDSLFRTLRSDGARRYALGYYFRARARADILFSVVHSSLRE